MMRMRSIREEGGAVLIESALALLLAVPVIFWLFELSMLCFTYAVLADAGRQGVRYAVVHGTFSNNCSGPSTGCADSSAANVVAVVDSYASHSLHDISNMQVQVSYPDATGSAPPSRVVVTIDYTYVPYIQLPGLNPSVSFTSEGRIVY